MGNYTCLIVDDNEIERDAIAMHLRKINLLEIKATCANGIEAATILMSTSIDIVFSDIDMPELSGMGLLKSIKNPPIFIFITSHTQYATESFDFDALDFVVKPATPERLLKATNKAIEYLILKKVANTYNNVPKASANDSYFFIKETKGFTRLNYDDVLYIESMGDFSKIYTSNDKHITLVNLRNLERQLPSCFLRVHKQYIVNLNQIVTITNSEILLNHDHTVPVSLLNRQELMDKVTSKTIFRHLKP